MSTGADHGEALVMIKIDSLTKRYGTFTAVDDVTFTAEAGRVTGFLGPNGAGKSTTMRVMVGLTPPTSGTARISGRLYSDLPNPGLEVGVLLDASAQHAGRTGREILTIAARTMGIPRVRVEEMLDRVSLTEEEADRRVRNYSLGMRQRLGIAHALMGDPSVLILDEPANGLDPAGIRWMRGLLKSYADRGGTVLLSSHLLNEVELIADEMILIGHGRIVAQGDKKSLLAGAHGAATSLVMSLDNTALATELAQRGLLVDPMGDGLKVNAPTEEVGRAALAAGIVLTDLRTGGLGLEDLFLELTSDTARDGAGAVPPPPPPPHGNHVPPVQSMRPVDSSLTPPGGHR
jgi:ABC-2 type transport system ATP-binding protein